MAALDPGYRRVRVPYPDARTAPVHERDLAALAVAALTEPGHERRVHTVPGAHALIVREQVAAIGAAIGREIAVEVIPVDHARAEMYRIMPALAVDTTLRAWEAGIDSAPQVSKIVEEFTGRPAHTFEQWARDHAADFC
ncbi:hypothetical protein [Nocardia noduli]|uniref:hypothetical protein n=1 Tax=Nocardia noduli TaxID=2815722 RepID=UPI001C2337AF|nr:hypothetical protein [Nocardia noduli]